MLIGPARVSTADQDVAPRTGALTKAGCEKLFTDKALERGDTRFVLRNQAGPDLLVVEFAQLIFLYPAPDQMSADVKRLAQNHERLAVEAGFDDHALQSDAVPAVSSCHGTSRPEGPAWGNQRIMWSTRGGAVHRFSQPTFPGTISLLAEVISKCYHCHHH